MNNNLEDKRLSRINLRSRLKNLNRELEKEPANLAIRTSIIRCLLSLDRFDEAYQESIKVFEVEPENPIAILAMGVKYSKQGNFEKGEECFRKVVMLLPEFNIGHFNLGAALNSQNKFDEGMQEINKGVKLNPFYWRGHLNLCIAHIMQNQIKEGFIEAKLAWKYHKSFETFTFLITIYDRLTKSWSTYIAYAFILLALIFPSPFTLLLLILGSGRLSISAFGIILYGNKKSVGYFIYTWVISMIFFFILRYNKLL